MEKSREIMRRLKEEKRQLEDEMKTRIDVSVGKLEEEREGEVQELKRGKVEALRLMQVRVCLSVLSVCQSCLSVSPVCLSVMSVCQSCLSVSPVCLSVLSV